MWMTPRNDVVSEDMSTIPLLPLPLLLVVLLLHWMADMECSFSRVSGAAYTADSVDTFAAIVSEETWTTHLQQIESRWFEPGTRLGQQGPAVSAVLG